MSKVSIPYRDDKNKDLELRIFDLSEQFQPLILVSTPYRDDKNFYQCDLVSVCFWFQPLIGTIKTIMLSKIPLADLLFQPLIGTIKT